MIRNNKGAFRTFITNSQTVTKNKVSEFNRKNVYIGLSKRGYGYTYFAKKNFKPGDKIMEGFGQIINHQTPHFSVQIGIKKHYLPWKWTGKYWNHSCDPNAYVKTLKKGFPALFALAKIDKGQEINYAYWMTENGWTKKANENTIKCECGSKNCGGEILSFSQLPKKKQLLFKQKGIISKYLLKKI